MISRPVNRPSKSASERRRRWIGDIAIYGICGGLLITALRLIQYRFLMVEHSVEIYAGMVAVFFAGVGIWLGLRLNRKKPAPAGESGRVAEGPFVANESKFKELGITPREAEILGLIAAGLSNREIAERLFVSENTIKTHSSRLFEKLGARRRTQAVQFGKAAGLIP